MKPLGASADADVTEYALVSPGSPTTCYDDRCLAPTAFSSRCGPFCLMKTLHKSVDDVTQAQVVSRVEIYNNLQLQSVVSLISLSSLRVACPRD